MIDEKNNDDFVALLWSFAEKMKSEMQDIDPEFSKIVDDHFWEMCCDDKGIQSA